MAEEGSEGASGRISDEVFMMECLKSTTSPIVVDVNIVAKALNYSNAQSVANRLSRLKKKFNLTISSTHGSSPVKGGANDFGAVGATATPTTTPRKRGRPAKKAPNPKTTEGDETPSKPTKTAGRKRKASDTDEDVDNEEPFTLKAEIKEEI